MTIVKLNAKPTDIENIKIKSLPNLPKILVSSDIFNMDGYDQGHEHAIKANPGILNSVGHLQSVSRTTYQAR